MLTLNKFEEASEKVKEIYGDKFDEIKTKNFATVMSNLNVNKGLVVLAENNANVVRSAKNIPTVDTTLVNTINVYDILNCDTLIVAKDAVAKIEEVYAR